MPKKQKRKVKETFSVEKVIDQKTVKGTKHYLIKWLGYSDSENTWEPESHLSKALIDEYNKSSKSETAKMNDSSHISVVSSESDVTQPFDSSLIACPAELVVMESAQSPSVFLEPKGMKSLKRAAESSQAASDAEVAEEVTAMTTGLDNELSFVIRFDNQLKRVVPVARANLKWPQLVIAYYEAHREIVPKINVTET